MSRRQSCPYIMPPRPVMDATTVRCFIGIGPGRPGRIPGADISQAAKRCVGARIHFSLFRERA